MSLTFLETRGKLTIFYIWLTICLSCLANIFVSLGVCHWIKTNDRAPPVAEREGMRIVYVCVICFITIWCGQLGKEPVPMLVTSLWQEYLTLIKHIIEHHFNLLLINYYELAKTLIFICCRWTNLTMSSCIKKRGEGKYVHHLTSLTTLNKAV